MLFSLQSGWVLKGRVRCLRQPLDQPRRLDPVTRCVKKEIRRNRREGQTRVSVRDVIHGPHQFRSCTLNSWALQRGTAETTGKRMGCAQGKPWNFLSWRPSGWSTGRLLLFSLAHLSHSVWNTISPSFCQAPVEPSRLHPSLRSRCGC